MFALERCAANHHFAFDQQIINHMWTALAKVRGSATVAILAQGTQPMPIASSWRKIFEKIPILHELPNYGAVAKENWKRAKILRNPQKFSKIYKTTGRPGRRSKNHCMERQRKIY